MCKQKFIYFLLLIFSVNVFCVGCSLFRENADVGMEQFCKAFINGDEELLKKYDASVINKREQVRENFIKKSPPKIKRASDKQLQNLGTAAYEKFFVNNSISCKILNESDNHATVEITLNQYSNSPNEDAITAKMKERRDLMKTDQEFTEQAVIIMTELTQEQEPVGKGTFVVDCVYDADQKVWKPKNLDEFVNLYTSKIIAR
ncbi:MAG: hypothetical protein J6O04_09720 [Selenomonadaceae bacterium]|nr:hypothetical protein [Selenomonadaceae bacterium]